MHFLMSGEEEGNSWVFGLTFIGAGIILIVGAGVWSSQNPYSCVKIKMTNSKNIFSISVMVCQEPSKDLPNGKVLFVYNGTIPEGSMVKYTCNAGHKLIGPDSKECVEEKGWVPNVEVICSKSTG